MNATAPARDTSTKGLRITLVATAVVFLGAALFNFGLEVPLGFTTLRFGDPIWQAGTGESVIAVLALAAGLTGGRRLSWVAWSASVLGIVFGLSSDRVQGAARDLHLVMIALAVAGLALLLVTRRSAVRGTAA